MKNCKISEVRNASNEKQVTQHHEMPYAATLGTLTLPVILHRNFAYWRLGWVATVGVNVHAWFRQHVAWKDFSVLSLITML